MKRLLLLALLIIPALATHAQDAANWPDAIREGGVRAFSLSGDVTGNDSLMYKVFDEQGGDLLSSWTCADGEMTCTDSTITFLAAADSLLCNQDECYHEFHARPTGYPANEIWLAGTLDLKFRGEAGSTNTASGTYTIVTSTGGTLTLTQQALATSLSTAFAGSLTEASSCDSGDYLLYYDPVAVTYKIIDCDNIGGGTDDQTAAEVPSNATGNVAATDVQTAIGELDAEKVDTSRVPIDLRNFATPGTEQTTEIQAAVDYACSSGRKLVTRGSAAFQANAPINTCTGLHWIFDEGGSLAFDSTGTYPFAAIVIDDDSTVVLDGLNITTLGASSIDPAFHTSSLTPRGILVSGNNRDITIKGGTISHFYYSAIMGSNAVGDSTISIDIEDVTVEDNAGNGIQSGRWSHCTITKNTIRGNGFADTGNQDWASYISRPLTDCEVSGNIVYDNDAGIKIATDATNMSRRVKVINNNVTRSSSEKDLSLYYLADSEVSGNVLSGPFGMDLRNSRHVTVSENIIDVSGGTNSGMTLYGVDNITLTDNDVKGDSSSTSQACVHIVGPNGVLKMSGGNIENCGNGVLEESDSFYHLSISDVTFRKTITRAIDLSAVDSTMISDAHFLQHVGSNVITLSGQGVISHSDASDGGVNVQVIDGAWKALDNTNLTFQAAGGTVDDYSHAWLTEATGEPYTASRVGIGGTSHSSYQLQLTSSAGQPLRTVRTSGNAQWWYIDGPTQDWQVGQESDGGFNLYNTTGTRYVFRVEAAAPSLALIVGSAGVYQYAPSSAPADGTFGNSSCLIWQDEVSDEVEFKCKKSGGAVFSATVGAGASFTDLDTDYGDETITSDFDFGGGTLQVPNSATLPATCEIGDSYWDTDADTNGSLYVCRAADTWKEVDDDGGAGGLATEDIDTSAELAAIVTDETGSGALVFGTSPTIATPALTLPDANGAAPTTDGEIKYDRTTERIEVGDGVGTNEFYAGAHTAFGDATDLEADGSLSNDVVAAAEMADADHGDVSWTSGVATVENVQCTDCIVTGEIADGTILNADISSSAAITTDKLATEVRSFIWPAGAMVADETNCAAPATNTIGTNGPAYTVICTDNDGSTIYGDFVMPDSWDGSTITFELTVIQDAADTANLNGDISAQCRGDGETSGGFGTEVALDIATLTGSDGVDTGTSAAVTPTGTCAGGDWLQWRWQMDATGTTTAVATLNIMAMKIEWTSTIGD